jgi:ABC-type branched-subunit amino acid transport system substrate-binding protein
MSKATLALAASIFACAATYALAETGITDKEIKIGQTMPYSGPASAYGAAGRTETSYYNRLNAQGGINGRKINFLSYDDAYSPPKTVEQTRKLVEQDEIFADFGSLGTAPNSAIHKYLNQKKVPHLFLSTGADKWNDPKNFPYTMMLYPSYTMEGRVAAKYVLKERPNGKIAILSQNDDAGRDYVRGFKEGLGAKAATMIVKEVTYEVSDPTVDSQMVALKSSGADVFFNMTTPKFAAQAIRKTAEMNWKPLHYIVAVASSIKSVLQPAGVENAVGLVTAISSKIPADPRWANDKETQDYLAFMKEWNNNADPNDGSNTTGYNSAWLTEYVLRKCGADLTRENLMKVVTNLKDVQLPLSLPGVTISSTPDNYGLFGKLQVSRFDGRTWEPIGPVIEADAPGARAER